VFIMIKTDYRNYFIWIIIIPGLISRLLTYIFSVVLQNNNCLFVCCVSRDKRKRDEGDSSDRTKESKKSKEVMSLLILIKPTV